jgi:hypothetical protein
MEGPYLDQNIGEGILESFYKISKLFVKIYRLYLKNNIWLSYTETRRTGSPNERDKVTFVSWYFQTDQTRRNK